MLQPVGERIVCPACYTISLMHLHLMPSCAATVSGTTMDLSLVVRFYIEKMLKEVTGMKVRIVPRVSDAA